MIIADVVCGMWLCSSDASGICKAQEYSGIPALVIKFSHILASLLSSAALGKLLTHMCLCHQAV